MRLPIKAAAIAIAVTAAGAAGFAALSFTANASRVAANEPAALRPGMSRLLLKL